MSGSSSNSSSADTLICSAIIAIEAGNNSLTVADLTTLSKKFGHQTVVDSYLKMVKEDSVVSWDDLISLGNLNIIGYSNETDAIAAIELAVLLVIIKKHLNINYIASGATTVLKITNAQTQLALLLTKAYAPANFNANDSKPIADFLNFVVSGVKSFKIKYNSGTITQVIESDIDYKDYGFFKSTKEHAAFKDLYKLCQYLKSQNGIVTYPQQILPYDARPEDGLGLRGFSNTETDNTQLSSYAKVAEIDLAETYKQVYSPHKERIVMELTTAGPDSNSQIPKANIFSWASKSKGSSNDASSAYFQLTALDINTLLGFMDNKNTSLAERKSGDGKKKYSLNVSKVNSIANIKKLTEPDLLSFFQIGSTNASQAGTSSDLVTLLTNSDAANCKATGYAANGTTPETTKDETFDSVFAAWADSKRTDDFSFGELKTEIDIYNFLTQNGSNSLVNADAVAVDDAAGLNASSTNANSNKKLNKILDNLALAANTNTEKATNSIPKLYAGVVMFAKKQLEFGKTNTSHKKLEDAVASLLVNITLTANDPDTNSTDDKIISNYLASLSTEQTNQMKFAALLISKAGVNAAFSSNPDNADIIRMFVKLASKSKSNPEKYLYAISASHSNPDFMPTLSPVEASGALNSKFGVKRDTYFVAKPLFDNASNAEKLSFYVASLIGGQKIDSKSKFDTAADDGFNLNIISKLNSTPKLKNEIDTIGQASQTAAAASDKTATFVIPVGGSSPGQFFKGYKFDNDAFKAVKARFGLVTSLISIADEDTQTNSVRAFNIVSVFETLPESEKKQYLGQLMDKLVTSDGSPDGTDNVSKNYETFQRIISRWVNNIPSSEKVLGYAKSSGSIAAMWLAVIKAVHQSNIVETAVMESMADTTASGFYSTANHYTVTALAILFNIVRNKDSYVDPTTGVPEIRVTLRDINYPGKQRRNILAMVAEAIRDEGKTYRLAKTSVDNLIESGQFINDIINAATPYQSREGFTVGRLIYQYFVAVDSDGKLIIDN